MKATAPDAIDLGFTVHLVEDACRDVNISAGDARQATEEIRAKGGALVRADELAEVE